MALVLVLALLSGCCAAATPAEGEEGRPNPFALGLLPTPTNTAGVASTAVVLAPTETAAASSPLPATPIAAVTPAWTASPEQPGAQPTATGSQAPAPTETPVPAPGATTPATSTLQPDAPATPAPSPIPSASPIPTETPIPSETPASTTAETPTPTAAVDSQATPTSTRAITIVPANTPTPPPAATATPTPVPTEPASGSWDLARDVIGMWEYVEEDWRYYFDFFPDGRRAVISEIGIRPYEVRDSRTLLIRMPEGEEWLITVADLTPERITLEGVINASDDFHRVHGTPGLASKIVGLWLDESGEYPSVGFISDGIVVSEFGRGTYQVVSDNSVLVTCDEPEDCTFYHEFGQDDDAPLALRIHSVENAQLTMQGFGYGQQWTLDHRAGIPNLAAGLLGRWEDDWGLSIEFTDGGDWIVDDNVYGSYEVLSDSILWTELDGSSQPLVVTELTANQLAYAEWGYFYEEDLWIFNR